MIKSHIYLLLIIVPLNAVGMTEYPCESMFGLEICKEIRACHCPVVIKFHRVLNISLIGFATQIILNAQPPEQICYTLLKRALG